ncbi:unnamed protein product [Blepharisma stoltei]|uniref:UDP-N-acetylglucosamine--peptide N-acetylglucosaminyltransferase SPINDLY n=1 Tax=Blepharisma stoltei TaxID=1481888 RepID=A0AAU9K5M6_9CILI|nr:unnamed protein product [Blepharisma stoltei]
MMVDTLRNKTAEILSKPNNRELEIDFRTTCSAIQTNSFDPPLMQAYQDYLNAYQQKTSLYNIIGNNKDNITSLIIYNTETETEEVKTLQTSDLLGTSTCITQLPNGKLFCFGNYYRHSGITMLIDTNGEVEVLPSGTPCQLSSCIYFDNSVYCFGGCTNKCISTLSSRFDLDLNHWIHLTPMQYPDFRCSSIIFNGNILISRMIKRKLLLYSIDIDSFSIIPHKFKWTTQKILINAERPYLIECPGLIYESEIGSYLNWRQIGKSAINQNFHQVDRSYNKGGICISFISGSLKEYYCFNLNQKTFIDFAYYNEHVSLRKVGKKIEAIEWNIQSFKLDPYFLDEWGIKGNTLHCLGQNLEKIELSDERIKFDPSNIDAIICKGEAFHDLERYLEAIDCYDEGIKIDTYGDAYLYYSKGKALDKLKRYLEAIEYYDRAIKINSKNAEFYNNKGNALFDLERYLEAIECYDKAIKLNPKNADFYYNKGNALYGLQKYLEAIEFYDEAIKLNQSNADFYYYKGKSFYGLQRYLEAIECYDEASKYLPSKADIYNHKGTAFFDLERYLEAVECFDKAIKLDPNNADFYYKKGCSLYKLGSYPEAVERYDEAIKINPNKAKFYSGRGNTLYILERCQEAIQCYDEANKLEPDNPLHFYCRAKVFNNLRQEEAALQDFNRAYHLKQENQEGGAFNKNEWNLSEKDINFINDVLGRDRIELLRKMQI